MGIRRSALIVALIAASLGWPGQAYAAGPNAFVSGNLIRYIADPGKANNLVITLTAAGYTFDDVVTVTVGAGCVQGANSTIAVCQVTGITRITVESGDLDDYVDNYTSVFFTAYLGNGNDTALGFGADDRLWGQAGNDYLSGFGGNDLIVGGPGTDQMYGGSGTLDTVSYIDSPAGVGVDLDGVADDGAVGENDFIASDFEFLMGSEFADWLIGSPGSDQIYGFGGGDILSGADGDDYLYGDGEQGPIGGDYFFGGGGVDYASYSDHRADQAVVADNDGVTGDDGATGEGDTIAADVENLGGSPGNDWLVGNGVRNQINGGDGGDIIVGYGGDDNLFGEGGNDYVFGGDGNDFITGEAGDDSLYGENNSDTLHGGAGTDACDVGPGGTTTIQCP
jgi:Ca2+-binding RTX toxin-like protein